MKVCSICSLEKEMSLFYKNILFKDGYFKYCKKCHKEKATIFQKEKLRSRDEKLIFLKGEFFIEHFNTGLLCSNYGRIFYNGNSRQKHFLKQTKMKNGYFCISFNSKHIYVHRLIAESMIKNTKNKTHVNHIDENKLNNKSCNLEWCTHLENIAHSVRLRKLHKQIC
jgi:hypothetical protein